MKNHDKTEKPCKRCNMRESCAVPCENLERHVRAPEGNKHNTTALSSDYMDKTFPAEKAGMVLGDLKYKALEMRGKAVRKTIQHFTGYGINGVLYYWIWQVWKQEGIPQQDIAYMLNMSQQRVSQIINVIKSGELY